MNAIDALNTAQTISMLHSLLVAALDLPADEPVADDAAFGVTPGWDSFSHIVLMDSIAQVFGVTIGPDQIDDSLDMAGLTRLLSGQAGQAGLRPAAARLLADLCPGGLRADDVVYVHSRWQGAGKVLGGLTSVVGELMAQGRTVVVPAFPFSSRSYAAMLDAKPAFSVTQTPPATGVLAAALWRHPEACRSAHPLLSDCALGPLAPWLTADAHTDPAPFHPASVLARLVEKDGLMLGLGVDIATNAIIHWADDVLAASYPFPLYEPAFYQAVVGFADGRSQDVAVKAYHRDLPRRMRPRNLRPFLAEHPDICREMAVDEVPFYALRARPFVQLCVEVGRQALEQGRLPPWHDQP